MGLHAQAYRATMAPLGVRVTNEEVYQLEGGRSESVLEHFLKKAAKPADSATIARLQEQKQDHFRRLGPPSLYEGAEDLVRKVRLRSEKLAIVTGTRKENLERLIPTLMPLFDRILAQDSYSKDKPDPEPYAKAAAALGVPAAQCIAVENAPFGVKSARAAGYGHVVAITTTVSKAQLVECGAHVVVQDHEQVAEAVLKALG